MVDRATTDVPSAILAAATRLFASRGFEGTAVQDIADAVGVSKPAVLHHFATKERLREAVLETILAHWKDTLPQLLLAATASEDRFERVVGELWRFFSSDRDRARLVIREALDRPAELKRMLRGPVRPWLGAVAEYIRAGQSRGHHYPDVDAEAYVLHILQLVLVAAASGPVTSAVLDKDAEQRYDRELVRIARASLFVNPEERDRTSSARTRKAPSKKGASRSR
jgi:AcrR family transcriptional regulator